MRCVLIFIVAAALLSDGDAKALKAAARKFNTGVAPRDRIYLATGNKVHGSKVPVQALQFTGAVSRKTHGAAGIFDIPLPLSPDSGTGTPYLLGTFFNGAGGSPYSLTVVSSEDGYNWKLVQANAYVPSSGEIRDPSVIKIGDTLWCVYTSGIFGLVDYFSLIKSTDGGLSWTFVKTITSLSGATHTWAPEWFRDSDDSVHVQVAVSTDNYGSGGTINIYELHPTTFDPAGTWSAAVSTPIPTWNSNAYDPSTIKVDNTYYTYVENGGCVYVSTASSLTGPYSSPTLIAFGDVTCTYGEGMNVFPLSYGYGMVLADSGYKFTTSNDLIHWSATKAIDPAIASGLVHGSFTVVGRDTGDVANQINSASVECRSGGTNGDYTFVFIFTNNVTSGSANVGGGVGQVSGSPVFAGKTMIVNVTGVANAQTLAVSVGGVTDEFAQTLPTISVNAKMLIGDTTGNGSVNSSDVTSVKVQSGQSITAANFRQDVTANGTINASDVSSVKLQSGTSLP